jgi:hypothetical protein
VSLREPTCTIAGPDGQLTRVRERIAVLTELEDRLEGSNGVQDVPRAGGGGTRRVAGAGSRRVADLFHVDVDTASLWRWLSVSGRSTSWCPRLPLLDWLEGHPVRVATVWLDTWTIAT